MKHKRILVVASTFPASETDPIPAFVRDQLMAMKEQYPELEISVLAPHDKRSNTKNFVAHEHYNEYRFHYAWPYRAEKLAGRGIMPALKANPLNYLLIPFLFIGEFVALTRLTRELKPDFIYAHWFTPQAVTARWTGTLTKTPFVFTTHAADVAVWHKIPVVGRFIVRNSTRHARAFTAVSRRSMAKLERFFAPKEWSVVKKKSALIPMGTDIPAINSKPKTNRTNGKTILFVGRLTEKKGVQYLLPAYKKIRGEFENTKLVIAGDGQWLDRLQKQAADLGLDDDVSFPGYVSGDQKHQLISSADIYVVPSIITTSGDAEGLPVSLMEGLAYGKLCIATNESGGDDIITDQKSGYLVPEKNADQLTTALKSALSLETSQAKHMQEQAMKTAAQFDWPHIAKLHYEFFERQLKK